VNIIVFVAALILTVTTSSFVHAEGDAARGEQLYESRCIACHSLDANRVGPKHRGVYGRQAGVVPDFDYSVALATSRIVWSDTTLDRWLTDPEAFIPGQRMSFRVLSMDDRADIIAFLKRASGQ
jgi:cytochrome c